MTIVNEISALEANSYDYVVVGGGTAGCVIASRLAQFLPNKRILVIEGGPSDFMDDRVLKLKEWLNLLGGEFDYDYPIVEQPNGNSHIRHSRAKVLGGCSSHNTLISFRPFEFDCQSWVSKGCTGWDFGTFTRLIDNIRNTIQIVDRRHQNQLCKDWIESCSTAMEIPIIEDFNKEIRSNGDLTTGVGFFNISYNPNDGRRSSASVAYIHPILRGEERRPNLTILTNAWVSKINVEGNDSVVGVNVKLHSGVCLDVRARKETILSAGAIDTPRLMMLSGIGPHGQLSALGIPVAKDIPGVGENLLDHPESLIMWDLNRPFPREQTTMDSDAGVFLRRENLNGSAADIMMHCYQGAYSVNTNRLGYEEPVNAFCMSPNVPRPRSRGRIYLVSPDPDVKPALDFRYFTDPEGYDSATIVAGLRAARQIAQQAPFKDWIKREVAPGPGIQTDDELSEYGRRVAHTVYHPAGTTKMGDVVRDKMAVVDPELKVRGLKGIRIADAGVFPDMPSVNPMLTVLAIGERAAKLIALDAGWKPSKPHL